MRAGSNASVLEFAGFDKATPRCCRQPAQYLEAKCMNGSNLSAPEGAACAIFDPSTSKLERRLDGGRAAAL